MEIWAAVPPKLIQPNFHQNRNASEKSGRAVRPDVWIAARLLATRVETTHAAGDYFVAVAETGVWGEAD
jgi:hypothetical protein